MERLLGFYLGSHSDNRGRYLSEILVQDDLWFEVTHDYIQWLFPTREFSRVTPDAPVITSVLIEEFHQDEILRNHLKASFYRMLQFYGLTETAGQIGKARNWDERKVNWFVHDTHNNLRITRMLKSMMALGLEAKALSFHDALQKLCACEIDCGIGSTARDYWNRSIRP